ncbi:MAG: DUF2220 family protein [Lachnospiraceae bacterium]|nr:DUF2220 family protein [Lachnospiraceae bacterium]
MKYEEKILTLLVENYRKSKKDSGENKTNRRTQIKPEKLYKKYNANDGEYDEISKLNQSVDSLMARGFLTKATERFGTQIQCIYLVDEKLPEIERYLAEKYNYVSKDMQMEKLRKLVDMYRQASPICEEECRKLEQCIEERKIPKNIDELDGVLKAVSFIENNKEFLYIREVSMRVYGDSKYFEDTTLVPVCALLRKHIDRTCSEAEMQDEILLAYHIAKEPMKLCIKGKVQFILDGKLVDISGFSDGVEFSATELGHIQEIKVLAPEFMTIENRTSYLRYQREDVVTFYLGGYTNRYQRDFIKKVYDCNPGICYTHFGDIDAGGFYIHRNLCEVTGIDFQMYSMSEKELQNPCYTLCLHKLTENDRARLQELYKKPEYRTAVEYMLKNNVKLEQEIVSLNLMQKG